MISFDEVSIDDAETILKWRGLQRVTQFMRTDVELNIAAQRQWLASCYGKNHYYHWLIKVSGKPVGLLNICNFDIVQKTSSWGFYIGDEESLGYGAFVPPFLYNFLFGKLGIKNIDVEVFYSNIGVIGLHKLHGYKFSPAKDRVIVKNEREILLVAMNLSADEWSKNKRFRKSLSEFPTSKWSAKPDILKVS